MLPKIRSNPDVHYLITQEELRQRYKSTGNFAPRAICGNGEPHYRLMTTRSRRLVTCKACKKSMGIK